MTRRRAGKSLQASIADLTRANRIQFSKRFVKGSSRRSFAITKQQNSKESEYLVRAEQKTIDYLLEHKTNYLSRLEAAVKRSVGVQVEPDFDVDEFDFARGIVDPKVYV